MKKVVSVSLGSSKRDHSVQLELLGQKIVVERWGTNGSLDKAAMLLQELDGQVDVLALGGINLHLRAGDRIYPLRDGQKLAANVKETPLVDGSGIKDVVEPRVVRQLAQKKGWPKHGQRVLIVSALDRWRLAESLENEGCRLTIGDAMFALKLPLPFYSLSRFNTVARLTLPLLCNMPIKMLYPLGEKQETSTNCWNAVYEKADIIAGDFHFIRRYMPQWLPGKSIITSTITKEDREFLRRRGIRYLVTTCHDLQGRSFGANVIEAICIALLNNSFRTKPYMYLELLKEIGWQPSIAQLNK